MTNKIHDAFDNIKADNLQKEATKQYLSERYSGNLHRQHRHHHRRTLRYMVSAVCAMLVLVIGGIGFTWVQTPVSYVSIDVNPSIELGLNRFDRVVSAEAYNAEGEAVLSGLPLKWKKYTDAIDAVIGCEEMRAYLTDASDLVLTVAADPAREAYLTEGVRACARHVEGGCHRAQADINVAAQAHESGLSCGKYNAWLQLQQYDSSITIDDCREMSMSQIQEKLREYKRENRNEGNAENSENEGCDGAGMSNGGEDGDLRDGYESGNDSASRHRRRHHKGGSHE